MRVVKVAVEPADERPVGDSSRPAIDLNAVHRSMPQGLAVVATDGTFREVNDHVLRMLGRTRDEVLGRSVLDFVHPDDYDFAVDVVHEGQNYDGMVTGPVQIRYLDADGRAHSTDLWSRTCIGVPGIDGFVVMMSEESTVEMLPDAVRAIAAAEPVDEVLTLVARALTGHPVQAAATFLVARAGRVVPIGAWPLGSSRTAADRPGAAPWHAAMRDGVAVDVETDELADATFRVLARTAGVEAIWCRPVATRNGQVPAVLVVWRSRAGAPSTNQQRHLADAVSIAALAFDQQAYRRAMERRAFVDPVSGLGNRARFEQLLASGDRDVDGVLYVDLDRFKDVNDRLGHAAGDQILAHVASRLKGAVRAHDEVIRVGGDEFVVMCRPPATPANVESLAARVVRVLGEPYALDGGDTAELGASVGVVVGDVRRPLDERVRMADIAMYRAKEDGARTGCTGTWRRADRDTVPAAR